MAREVGISRITLFPLTKDVEGQDPTWGAGYRVPWAVNFESSNEYSEGEYYADNIIENSIKQIAKVNVTMEVSSDTPPALEAKITGKGYKNGKSFVATGQVAPYHAIAYEIAMDNGNLRRRIIYKVALAKNSRNNATQEDSLEGQTFTYEGTGVPLVSCLQVEMEMDLAEINAISDPSEKALALNHWNKFFEQPILPTEEEEIN